MPHELHTNKHGVVGILENSGHFGHSSPNGSFIMNLPIFVPQACLDCQHYDRGEFGDYGSKLSPPYCAINCFFPTKKGTCARKKPWRKREGEGTL